MEHQKLWIRLRRIRADGYLSAHRGNQWIFATFIQRQSLEDARHCGACRLWSRHISDALKHRMHLRQETSYLLADVLYDFDAGERAPSSLPRHPTQ
jgi:hypothetical protein